MPLKFIGISQRLIENSNYFEIREALSLEWGEFFLQHLNGYLPLPLSYEIPFVEYAQRLNGTLKGIILSGGNDLNILNANQISQKRDEYEGQIITYCLEESLPLLGVCRGAQRVAEYFGANFTRSDIHIGKHSIQNLTTYQKRIVNSFHNCCIEKIREPLYGIAFAEDSTIEAFRHKHKPIFGVMWHIERENGMCDASIFEEWKKKL